MIIIDIIDIIMIIYNWYYYVIDIIDIIMLIYYWYYYDNDIIDIVMLLILLILNYHNHINNILS